MAGFLGGVAGGAAQSYLTMGEYMRNTSDGFTQTNMFDV